jgi:hypothetical protein
MEKKERMREKSAEGRTFDYLPDEYIADPVYLKASNLHLAIYSTCCICSCGLLLLVSSWFPQFFSYIGRARLPRSTTKNEASHVLLKGPNNKYTEVQVMNVVLTGQNTLVTYFEYRKNRYALVSDSFVIHVNIS